MDLEDGQDYFCLNTIYGIGEIVRIFCLNTIKGIGEIDRIILSEHDLRDWGDGQD